MISNNVLEKLEYLKVLEYVSRYTSTETGKTAILNSRPLNNKGEIVKQGKYVSEAKEILINNDFPPIDYLPDLFEVLSRSKIEGAVLFKADFMSLLSLAQTSRQLRNFLARQEKSLLYDEIGAELFIDRDLENEIQKIFDDNGEIRDSASRELKEIRKDINSKSQNLRKVINQILKKLSANYFVQDEYTTQRDGRFVLPVKAEHKRHVKGFIHSESATGQTVYIEPEETLNLNNEILSLNFAEKREIDRILQKLTQKVGASSIELARALRFISQLDAIFAKAKYSIEIVGEFPEINESKKFQLLDGRHPILIKKIGRANNIPLNIELTENVILITGPNAGGKTVVLKTVGLLMLMVYTGLHIPAHADSNVHIFENILMDIGDQQSIEDDLSTFSSHLTSIKNILDEVCDKSLVLIDEIGTGTDPAEGSALAAAVLIKLCDANAKVLATTHHGNLKMIANDMPGFENASMEYDTEHLKPTYRFLQGLPGSSYAFEVAERIGYNLEFIELAKKYLDTDKNKIEEFLVELEKKTHAVREKLNKAEIENSKLKGLTSLYESKLKKLEKEKKEIVSETQAKAELYLKDVNKKVEAAIKNIRESQASKDVVQSERKILNELKISNTELKKEVQKSEKKLAGKKKIEVGDTASIENTTTSGTVIEINESKDKAVLASGSIKLQVKLSKLVPEKKKSEQTQRVYGIEYTASFASHSLDLRGKRPEEMEFETIRFLDDAYTSGLSRVEIIHGKGTGALKKAVHDLLKQHSQVKDYYFAKIEMGGEGVTIIEFK